MTGDCFNCGQPGHNKADCPNPAVERPFTGTCRICEQEGHRAAACPQKEPTICRGCGATGHVAADCTVNRKIDRSRVADMTKEEAWAAIRANAADKDMEGVRRVSSISVTMRLATFAAAPICSTYFLGHR